MYSYVCVLRLICRQIVYAVRAHALYVDVDVCARVCMCVCMSVPMCVCVHVDGQVLIISSQAAAAVLVFNAIKSPLAQPRNVIGGNVVGAVVGVAVQKVLPDSLNWLAVPLSVSLASQPPL